MEVDREGRIVGDEAREVFFFSLRDFAVGYAVIEVNYETVPFVGRIGLGALELPEVSVKFAEVLPIEGISLHGIRDVLAGRERLDGFRLRLYLGVKQREGHREEAEADDDRKDGWGVERKW